MLDNPLRVNTEIFYLPFQKIHAYAVITLQDVVDAVSN